MFNFLTPFTSFKYLWWQLVAREIKSRYKQSFIGYLWVILNPLAQLLVYTFVFSVIIKFKTDVPYPIFLFAALLPWIYMQNTLLSASQSLVNNSTLLKKISFPREIIPYSVVIAKGVDFVFSSLIFLALTIIMGVTLSPQIIWLPVILLAQMLLMTGLSLMLAAFNLFYRDIQYLANLVIMLWMYLSPIVYPLDLVPAKYLFLYELNPLVGIIEGYRSSLFGLEINYVPIYWALFISLLIFVIGYRIFKKMEIHFADIV